MTKGRRQARKRVVETLIANGFKRDPQVYPEFTDEEYLIYQADALIMCINPQIMDDSNSGETRVKRNPKGRVKYGRSSYSNS